MDNVLFLKPQKIVGMSFENPNPFIIKRKKGIFFLISVHSAINMFNLNTLLIRAKSPFLHHNTRVSHIISIKNRTIVVLKNTIQILDYLIPTTRFIFQERDVIFFFPINSNVLIFHKFSNKIMIFDPWKFKILSHFILQKDADNVQIEKCNCKENLILIFTNFRNIEIWNPKKSQKIVNFSLDNLFPIFSFKYINNFDYVVFGSSKGKILMYNLTNQYKIFELIFKETGDITQILFTSFLENLIFIGNKKCLASYDIITKTVKMLTLNCHHGKIFVGQFIKNSNLFLTMGIYDKNIVLHKYNSEKKELELILSRFVNRFPFRKIETNINMKNLIISINIIGELYFLKFNYFGKTFCIDLKSKKKTSEKNDIFGNKKTPLKIIQFQARFVSSAEEIVYVAICFYKTYNPYVWKIDKKKTIQVNNETQLRSKKWGVGNSICFSRDAKQLLIGYENNFISLFNLSDKEYSFIKNNHIDRRKNNCSVNVLSYDKYNEFFVSGCSCGFLLLWRMSDFKTIRNLDLKKKICMLKWCEKFDIILTATIDNEIQILFPETFSLIRRCLGHKKQITDFLIIRKSKFLFSSSLDKTIKTWNLFRNACESTVKFKYSPIALAADESENILISCHENTVGIGFMEICKKTPIFFTSPFCQCSLEKNGKISSIHKPMSDNLNISIQPYHFKNLILEEKNLASNDRFYNKFKIYSKKKCFRLINDFFFYDFEYYRIDKKNIKNFFKDQVKTNQFCITNSNFLFFSIEIFIDNIICKLNLKSCVDFFLFICKKIHQFLNIQNHLEPIFKRISVELTRQHLDLD
nr:WD repeat-containing protein 13 [Cryptomonas sp.]